MNEPDNLRDAIDNALDPGIRPGYGDDSHCKLGPVGSDEFEHWMSYHSRLAPFIPNGPPGYIAPCMTDTEAETS